MAIIKETSSGKGVQFVDDDGNVFMTSKSYLLKYLNGESKAFFLLLTRMPIPIDVSKFKKSPVLGEDVGHHGAVDKSKINDAWSRDYKKSKEVSKSHSQDVDV